MPKPQLPLRIGLDLGENSLNALLFSPEGQLRPYSAALSPDGALESAFSTLLTTLLPAGAAPTGTPAPETVLCSSRPFSALRRGPKVALLITHGFEDVLLLDGDSPPSRSHILANLRLSDLCKKEFCVGVPERLGADGAILKSLTSEALFELRKRVAELGVSAVGVVLLHSYQNDAHERTVAEALAPLGLPVSLSSMVARLPDERARTGATLLDACLAPSLREELLALHTAGLSRILCTDSAGNVVPAAQALPASRVLTTSATGLRGAQRVAAAHGKPHFIALGIDQEGKYATVALCDPLLPPDMAQKTGLLLAPRLELALGSETGIELGEGTPAQELGIVELDEKNANLEEALFTTLLSLTLDRGHNPSDYPLLTYGRVSPALAQSLGKRLGVESVISPPAPELLVAYGALCAPLILQRREILFVEASSAQQTGQVSATLSALTARLRADLRRDGYLVAEHLPGYEWIAEMRYQGQGMGHMHALTLPGLGDGSPAVSGDADLVVRFFSEHQRRYGFTLAECPVELLALRVRVTLPTATPSYAEFAKLAKRVL